MFRAALRLFCLALLFGPYSIKAHAAMEPAFSGTRGVSVPALVATTTTFDGSIYKMDPALNAMYAEQLHKRGVDLVRVVVRPAPLITGSSQARKSALDQILTVVTLFDKFHMNVIVDMHPWPPDNAESESNLICTSSGRDSLSSGLVMLGYSLYKYFGVRSALELLNEPKRCEVNGRQSWPDFQKNLYNSVRGVAPRLPIVVSAASGQLNDLLSFDVKPYVSDPNIYFSFHFYDPFVFTTPSYYNAPTLPFPAPGNLVSGTAALSQIDHSGMTAQQLREVWRYLTSSNDVASLTRRFQSLATWRRANGIPASRIIMGEFGVVRTPAADVEAHRSAALWLSSVSRLARQQGIRSVFWLWPLRPNFYTVPSGTKLRSDVIQAIGLETASAR